MAQLGLHGAGQVGEIRQELLATGVSGGKVGREDSLPMHGGY